MSWEQVPLRRVFRLVNGGTPTSDDVNWNGGVPWATPVDIGSSNGGYLSNTQRTLSDEGVRSGSRTVPGGSLLLSIRAPIGYVAQVAARTAFNQGCRGLVPTAESDLRFFRYQFLALSEELTARGAGSTFMELSTDALGAVPVRKPPLNEQRRIADFLDAETGLLDQTLSRRRMQVKLVAARRRRSIETLFEGEGLLQRRIKDLLISKPRYGVLVPEYVDGGAPFVRVNDLADISGKIDALRTIPLSLSAQYPTTVVKANDILVSVVGTLGRSVVAPTELIGANVNRAIAVLRTQPGVSPGLLSAWMGTSMFETQAMLETASDSAQRTLGMEDLGNFEVSWPIDEQEQARMGSALVDIESEHADLSAALDRQVSLLSERRLGLIAAAVTGQINVATARGVTV